MDALITVLLVLGVVLTIVTLVGHGIWVLLSHIFGGGRGSRPLGRGPSEQIDTPAALAALRRQLEEFAWRGSVDAETRARLAAVIDEQERRLLEKQRVASPALATSIAAAEPAAGAPLAEPAASLAAASENVAAEAAAQSAVPLAERARKYAVSRETAATEALAEVDEIPAEPPKRREAISRLLAAFMEEKNIRWGELVGGLLIVGCSIALVISLWSQIAERPLLKFVLFNGVTAALFGVGLYTDRRWKIHTTSHGVLVIATLLVPLNFLALAAFTQASPPTDLLSLAGEAVSLAVFALLVYLAGRIVVPQDALLLVGGVMIPCLMQLLVRRFAGPATPLGWLYALAGAPVASYLGTAMLAVRRRWEGTLDELEANRVLVLLGVASVATVMPLALLLYNVPPLRTTLHWLSPIVAVCGLPALLVGLLFWRRMPDRRLSGLQTAGIGVGVLGALVMAAAVALAWPDPATLLPAALLTAGVMLVVAVWFGIPAAHVAAGLALAAGWLIAFYLVRGDIGWTLGDSTRIKGALLSATSGHALVPAVGIFAVAAWWLRRINRRDDSFMYAVVTAATAAVSLALVVWFGFARPGDPANVTWTLAIYALAALVAAVVLDRSDVARVGSALLFAALVQGIVYRCGATWRLEQPWIVALLAHATLAAVVGGAMRFSPLSRRDNVVQAAVWSAHVTSIVAAAWIVATMHTVSPNSLTVNLAWLAVVWMLLATLARSTVLFTASQIAVVLAIFCGVVALLQTRAWYVEARHPWLDPWFLEALGVALAGYCLVLAAARAIVAKKANPQAAWWGVDHVVEVAIVLILALVATYAAAPGAAQELSPTAAVGGIDRMVRPIAEYEIAGIVHDHASGRGAWLLLAAVGVTLAVRRSQLGARWRVLGLVIVAMAIAPLLAAWWEPQVAVASALRWLSAGVFAIFSVAIWLRNQRHDHEVRDLLVALVVMVYVALGAYVCQAVLRSTSVAADLGELWPWALLWALVAAVVGLAIPYAAGSQRAGDNVRSRLPPRARRLHARDVLLLLAAAPVAILLTFAVAKALDARPIIGPEPGTWFRQIGWDVSYGLPLLAVALVFIGYAIRDRSSRFAFAAGLLFNGVATIVALLRLARGGGALDAAAWIMVAQANAIVAGVVALVWQAAMSWKVVREWPLLLVTQVWLAAALCGVFLVPAAVNLAMATPPSTWAADADGALGWSAVALATAAAVWLNWRRGASVYDVALFAAAVVMLVALRSARWDNGNWQAFHTLLAGNCIAAWIVPLVALAANRLIGGGRDRTATMRWSAPSVRFFAAMSVFLAVWGYESDPAAPWWSVAALVAISARNIWIAWFEERRGFVWIAAVLFIPAMSLLWLDWGHQFSATSGPAQALEFLWINVLAAALVALVSVWVERRIRRRSSEAAWQRGIAFHRVAAWAMVVVLVLTTAVGLVADLWNESFEASMPLAWAAWVAAAVAAAATLWDPAVRWPVACLYCVGLVAVGLYADGLDLRAPLFHWALANALAAYSLATSAVWSGRDGLRRAFGRWGVRVGTIAKPQAAGDARWHEGSGHVWLVPANLVLGVAVLLVVWWIELTVQSFTQRMVAAYAVGAQAFALGLVARGAVRTPLQYLALVWGVLFAVAFGWAWLPPDFQAPWLHRLVVTVAAIAVMVVVYGFGLVKFLRRENEWTRAARRLVPSLAASAAALIILVLGLEVVAYATDGRVPITWPALVAVGLALAGLAVAALAAAILPGRDPLGLSERGRTAYVYAAEALAALLFLHIRVTMPWLFHGWFLRFWPLVVMAIAFVGVGLGEVFQRRQQRVLSEPLERTGALLPLLPVFGFWALSNQVHYSLLLLAIGVLYAALSVLRKSLMYGVLATLAANGSLWFWLHERDGLSLVEHPQLWLIPPALSALAAGYINRERLTQQQSAALRYAAAIVIYVSSTADVFINGVAEAPWLPAVLAGLSIVGVLAGIVLRVRAFLYLGTAFLVVALMTIIWHAAIQEQHTWILWVAGIVTGALIIALFGLFEKRREDVLRVVEELKQWQA